MPLSSFVNNTRERFRGKMNNVRTRGKIDLVEYEDNTKVFKHEGKIYFMLPVEKFKKEFENSEQFYCFHFTEEEFNRIRGL